MIVWICGVVASPRVRLRWMGHEPAALGFLVEPSGDWFTKRNRILMYWPHDRRGRVVGEHVRDHVAVREIVPIATKDVITLEDAVRTLTPLPPFPAEQG